jgi:hypothetical protein
MAKKEGDNWGVPALDGGGAAIPVPKLALALCSSTSNWKNSNKVDLTNLVDIPQRLEAKTTHPQRRTPLGRNVKVLGMSTNDMTIDR